MVTNEFISECQSGNEEAIRILVRTHQRSVFQLALSILDHTDAPLKEISEQAEIATRKTFVTVLDRLERYRQDTPFLVWLSRIAVEVSQKHFRAWQRKRKVKAIFTRLMGLLQRSSPEDQRPLPSTEVTPPQSPTEEALWGTVTRLDDKLRLPLVLRYFHNLQINEIAGILRLSEAAVQARLDQAREKFFQP